MPRKQHSELAAGLFVLGGVAALLAVVIWLGAAEIFRTAAQTAYFYVKEGDDGGGLAEGSSVLIAGVEVGRVRKVYFDPKAARTYFVADIQNKDAKIHRDGKASLMAGLVGESGLSVTRGGEQSPLADSAANAIEIQGGLFSALGDAAGKINLELDPDNPKGLLTAIKRAVVLLQTQLDAQAAESLMAKIHVAVDTLNKAVASIGAEVDASKPDSMLGVAKSAVSDIKDFTAHASPKLQQVVTDVAEIAAKVNEYTQKDVADMLAKLRETNTEILKVAKDLAAVSEQTKQVVMVHRDDLDSMLDNMTLVSENLKAASKEIRRSPWRLLYKPKPEEMKEEGVRDAAQSFLSGAERLDHAISRLNGLVQAHPDGVDAKDPQILKVRQEVEESFENFKQVEDALWQQLKVRPPPEPTTQETK